MVYLLPVFTPEGTEPQPDFHSFESAVEFLIQGRRTVYMNSFVEQQLQVGLALAGIFRLQGKGQDPEEENQKMNL